MFNLGVALLGAGVLLGFWSGWGVAVFGAGLLVWVGALLRFLWQSWRGVPLPAAAAR